MNNNGKHILMNKTVKHILMKSISMVSIFRKGNCKTNKSTSSGRREVIARLIDKN